MNLVYIHGAVVNIAFFLLVEVFLVAPFVARYVEDLRLGIRGDAHMRAVGVGFEPRFPVNAVYRVFIVIVGLQALDKYLPHARIADQLHTRSAVVPAVEIADQRDIFCVLSPYSENVTLPAVPFRGVAAEEIISGLHGALVEEIKRKLVITGYFHCHIRSSLFLG